VNEKWSFIWGIPIIIVSLGLLPGCETDASKEENKSQAIESLSEKRVDHISSKSLAAKGESDSSGGIPTNIFVMDKQITSADLDRAYNEVRKISGIDYRKGYLGMTEDERRKIPGHISRDIESGWILAGRPANEFPKKKRYVDERIESCRKTFKELGYVKAESGISTGLVMVCGHILPPPYVVECRPCKKGEKGCEREGLWVNNVSLFTPCCGETTSRKALTEIRIIAEKTRGTKEWIARKRSAEVWKRTPKIREKVQGLFPNMDKEKLAKLVRREFEAIPYVKVLSVEPAFGEPAYRFGYIIGIRIEGYPLISLVDIFPKKLPPDHPQANYPGKAEKYLEYMNERCKRWANDIISKLEMGKCVYDFNNATGLAEVLLARAIRESSLDRYTKYEMLHFINYLWCPECQIVNYPK